MSKTNAFVTITALLILAIMAVGLQQGPVYAQGDVDVEFDFEVPFTLSGTIESIEPESSNEPPSVYIVTLDTGESFKVNPGTTLPEGALEEGLEITITVVMDDETYVAKVIILGLAQGTPDATGSPTAPATGSPTAPSTTTADCGGNPNHPVATKLANAFGVPYSEIMGWHCQGFGFGGIAKAYQLAKLCKEDPEATACLDAAGYLARKKAGEGWGKIVKESGVHPSKLSPGQIKKQGTAAAGELSGKVKVGGKKGGPAATKQANPNKGGKGKGGK